MTSSPSSWPSLSSRYTRYLVAFIARSPASQQQKLLPSNSDSCPQTATYALQQQLPPNNSNLFLKDQLPPSNSNPCLTTAPQPRHSHKHIKNGSSQARQPHLTSTSPAAHTASSGQSKASSNRIRSAYTDSNLKPSYISP